MPPDQKKPWNTPDFELKFREAMGRNMTAQEREFFGLEEEGASSSKPDVHLDNSRANYAWQALRRISALIG